MSKGGSTQLRATTRSSPTQPLAGRARPAATTSIATAPALRTHDVLPPCTEALARRARSASHASASPAKTEPWSSSDWGWRTPSTMAPDSTVVIPSTGSAAESQARRTGRWARASPTRPASRPDIHGSTSSGPSPSTGGSVVSRSFQPKTAWSATRARVVEPGSTEVSPSERRHSGPPSRKNRPRQITTAEMTGQPAARVRWVTTTAMTTPSTPTTRYADPVKEVPKAVSATTARAIVNAMSVHACRSGTSAWGRTRVRVPVAPERRGLSVIARSTAAGRRGLPWRRGGGRGGHRSR